MLFEAQPWVIAGSLMLGKILQYHGFSLTASDEASPR